VTTTQGAQPKNETNGHPLTGSLVDLDALFAEQSLDPVPVKLRDKTYLVRRDLTGNEVAECFRLINGGNDTEALAMLTGADDSVVLNAVLENLPQQHMKLAVRKILVAAGMVDDTEDAAGK
jgi:hypothetical protein